MRFIRTLAAIAAALLFSFAAYAQGTIQQSGPVTSGHAPMWVFNGIVTDSGPASGGAFGQGMNEGLFVVRGTGTAPYANAGTGPLGTNLCDYDAAPAGGTTSHYLCFSPNAVGGGAIVYGSTNPGAQLPLQFIINGVTYPFPGPGGGSVAGPATTISGDYACWNSTSGTLLSDCGSGGVTVANITASGSIAVTAHSQVVVVNKLTPAATSVILPASSSFPNCPAQPNGCPQITVKDGGDNASTYPITVSTADAKNIDTAPSFIISSNLGFAHFVLIGSSWVVE